MRLWGEHYDDRDYMGRFKRQQEDEGLVSEIWQPWWLPGDLRLTQRGVRVYEAVLAVLGILVLVIAMAVAGMVER